MTLTKKHFIIFNTILVAFFVFKLVLLQTEVGKEVGEQQDSLDNSFVTIQKPHVEPATEYRNIFGIKLLEAKIGTNDENSGAGLNELMTPGEIIRLRGIFITDEKQYAVISVHKKNQKRKNVDEIIKVGKGDKIQDFTVDAVLPESVILVGSPSEKINLKIFKPYDE